MNVEEILKKRADLHKMLQEKKAAIESEKRIPTPEERDERNKIVDEIMGLTNELETAELDEREANAEQLMKESRKGPVRPDIKRGVDETRNFRSFGDQLKAVIRAEGGSPDPRLLRVSGMSGSVPGDGGFLIQTDYQTELFQRIYENNPIVSRVRRIPISGNSNGIKLTAISETSRANGSRYGGIQAFWKSEGAEKPATTMKIRQVSLELKKLVGLCYLTDELLEDAVALEGYVRGAFNREFGFKLQDAFVNGTGAGMPLGILNSGAKISVTRNTASHVYAEDIIGMWARLDAACWPNAIWLINQDVMPELCKLSLETRTPIGGQLVFMPPGGLSQSPYGTLMGRPVIPIEQCATMGTSGDIILADFSDYIVIDKGGLQTASSIHVKFIYDETTLRFVMRIDGQPLWVQALTPFKGSNTVSPYVVLT